MDFPKHVPVNANGNTKLKSKTAIGLLLAALLLLVAPTGDASARQFLMSCGSPPTYNLSLDFYWPGDIKYKKHPRKCTYSEDGSMASTVILERMRWRGWGGPRVRAKALRVDNHDQDKNGFQRHPVRVTLKKPKAAVGKRGKRIRFYTRMVIWDREWGSWVMRLYRPGQGTITT